MDLSEFKAVAEANELAVTPYKKLVWAMLCTLLVFVLLFGGAFYYFMYKAFNMDTASYIAQDMNNSYNAMNNVKN